MIARMTISRLYEVLLSNMSIAVFSGEFELTNFSGDGLRNCMQLQLVQSLDHATTGPRLTKKTKKGSYSGEI